MRGKGSPYGGFSNIGKHKGKGKCKGKHDEDEEVPRPMLYPMYNDIHEFVVKLGVLPEIAKEALFMDHDEMIEEHLKDMKQALGNYCGDQIFDPYQDQTRIGGLMARKGLRKILREHAPYMCSRKNKLPKEDARQANYGNGQPSHPRI